MIISIIGILGTFFIVWSLFDVTSDRPMLWKILDGQEWYWKKKGGN